MKANQKIKKPHTIGLVLDFFIPKLLDGAHAYCAKNGLRLDARWSIRGDWTPRAPGWEGVMYGFVDHEKTAQRIKRWEIPRVGLIPDTKEEYRITPDYRKCGYMAAETLISSGAKSLLITPNTPRTIDVSYIQGAVDFAKEHSIPYTLKETQSSRLRSLTEELCNMLTCCEFPVGLIQPHAGVAYSLQDALIQRAIHIPEHVSMVVIDKDAQRTPELAPVPLTTIELDSWHRGFIAAEMVHRLMKGESLPQKHILLPPKGVNHRASTGHSHNMDQIVASTLGYLRDHYLEPIGVGDVVEAVGGSRRVLEMRFRETLNRGIHAELTRLRIEEAKRQIINNEKSITSIARVCGFSSVHYFSAAFKRETGRSPKQYQKQEATAEDSN